MDIIESCRAFLAGDLSSDELCRAVVRHPTWHLLVNDENRAWFWKIGDKNKVVALTENRPVNGIHAKSIPMSGRALLSSMGDDAEGIAFELGTDHAVQFSRAEIDGELQHYARAIDCEEALQTPSGSAAQCFANHTWQLLMLDDQPFVYEPNDHALVYAFTTPDALAMWRGQHLALAELTTKHVSGTELFATIAAMENVDGLHINSDFQLFQPLSPFVLNGLANGIDNRFDVRVLPARTIAEIHTFLDQMQVYRVTIKHEMAYRKDELVASYSGVVAGGREVRFDFTPVARTEDPTHLGDGKSEILCPGWLASELLSLVQALPKDAADLTDADEALRLHGIRWIRQIWALLDGRPCIPHNELLTVQGAAAVRKLPEIVTLDVLDKVFDRLIQYELRAL